MIIRKSRTGLHGRVQIPGDKSISHRAVMLGAISEGETHISGFLNGDDCVSTINCLRAMGVDIAYEGGTDVTVCGVGLRGLKAPEQTLDCGNSGTTTRIMTGLLAGQAFSSSLTGDASIRKRPMGRIIDPLHLMGADVSSVEGNGCAPLSVRPSHLTGITYASPVASAQVKSCILMAAMYADGSTTITEPALSRNHTELMLTAFGADIRTEGLTVTLTPGAKLIAKDIKVPGDISSAAYLIGAALIVPDSELIIENVGVNPTRDGIIRALKAMGGDIELMNHRYYNGEETADVRVSSSSLHGTVISGDIIPTLIDELPLLAVAAATAHGRTVIKDAAELKVKESDRIALVTKNLRAMGVNIEGTDDGFIINADNEPRPLHGAEIDDAFDHRIAMSCAVAGLIAEGETRIFHPECVSISYPDFFGTLTKCC